MKPPASMVAPVQQAKLTPTSASVPWDLEVATVKMVRKKQADDDLSALLIHVDVIFHQCTFSKVPYIFMGLMLLCWEGRENLFFNHVGGSSSVRVANQPKTSSF